MGKCISRLRGSVHCVLVGCCVLLSARVFCVIVSQVSLSLGSVALVLVALLCMFSVSGVSHPRLVCVTGYCKSAARGSY